MKDEAIFIRKMRNLGYVDRWSSYPVMRKETVAEHSFMVAVIATVLDKAAFGEEGGGAALLSLLHDAEESVTGDLLSLVKQHVRDWQDVEQKARYEVFGQLTWFHALCAQSKEHLLIKIADAAAALLYATEQVCCGNQAFMDIEAECLYGVYELAKKADARLHKATFDLMYAMGYAAKKMKERPLTMTHP